MERGSDEIRALCRRLGIQRLDVFGSAVAGDFDELHSDVDVLVEFDTSAAGSSETYMELKHGLQDLLGRPVDVVLLSAIRNPYFRASAERTREPLYAA
ncbi:MAG: nucleotidyltransferase domain-containing protein [Pseudonocardia sp.]|nr:nucleotidyltransferase domain-containing protein [Pseudonocardia sp.]